MDKDKARGLLFRYAHYHHGEHAIRPSDTDAFCEAIAQAAEEETAVLEHRLMMTEGLAEEVERNCAGLRAQLAMMAEALQELRDAWWDKHYPADVFDGSSGDEGALEVVRLREVIYQALSAAPKVVRKFTGRWEGGDRFGNLTLPHNDGNGLEIFTIYSADTGDVPEEFGQQVEVFAIECPVKEGCQPRSEQGQSTEQLVQRTRRSDAK